MPGTSVSTYKGACAQGDKRSANNQQFYRNKQSMLQHPQTLHAHIVLIYWRTTMCFKKDRVCRHLSKGHSESTQEPMFSEMISSSAFI